MKKSTALLAAVMLCLCIAAHAADDAKPAAKPADAAAPQADQKDLQTAEAKVNYMIGFTFQKQIPVKFDQASFLLGIQDAQQEKTSRVTPEQMQAVQSEVLEKIHADAALAGEKNKKEGDDYLAENGKKKGVITTKSGLQYTVAKEGTGASPKLKERVHVNYTGTFIGGKKFDSSADHPDQPSIFPVGSLVPGFNEALLLMKVGGKYNLVIPGELGYGDKASQDIGPNRTLLFEVELLEILPPEAANPHEGLDMGAMEGMPAGHPATAPAAKDAKPAAKDAKPATK
jgi:FKBP-type peptidyl-prolyl cis-trans isomerase